MNSSIERLVHLSETGKLPTALAFVGPTGSGKTAAAEAFAQKLSCREASGSLHWLKPSGEMIKVEQVHELLKRLSLKSLSHFRLVIIDPASQLNPQSSNALLKVLEEPPENTHFLLITSTLSSLLPTIRSRVQVVRFFNEEEEWQDENFLQLQDAAREALLSLSRENLEGWLELLPTVKERASALRLAKMFQLFFRDLVRENPVLPLTEALRESFRLEAFQIAQAWEKAFEMEMAVNSNADRSLVFQNYYYQFQELRREEGRHGHLF